SRNDAVGGIVGVGDIGADVQPGFDLVVYVGLEIVSFKKGHIDDAFFLCVTTRQVVAELVGGIGDRHLVVFCSGSLVGFVIPVGLVAQIVGQNNGRTHVA